CAGGKDVVTSGGAVALRRRRQGAPAPPAPPARDCVPWNPDLMHSYAENLARMLTGNVEQAFHDPSIGTRHAIADACFGIRKACASCGGEREGRSPLASIIH